MAEFVAGTAAVYGLSIIAIFIVAGLVAVFG